ncbi:GAF domain-containing protein [Rhodohalobacter sp. SW132]|uniref:GAF domain-containing SpoIIE family protein phosphatase n=1 Tax=Rhodohalobacter sp. SW132 TaxID=2293433 RepID=UPI000E274271|nr:GAF domain-containing SpoIIE family protein phosphatase [Rhodohalobacter sp. SW132]REL24268.1 GAF domain-containing protein [Rhodohalobacter sp. SW132]
MTEDSKYLLEENKRLRRAVDELAILNDLALAISGSLDSEKIMRSIISKSIRALNAEQGDITLIDEEKSNPTHTLVRSMITTSEHSPLHLNQNLLGWMQLNKKPLLINEPENDTRFRNVKWDSTIYSLLSAPLMARSKLIGIVTVYNKRSNKHGGFSESDQRLLSIISAQSAQVVENARLYEEEKAYEFMRRELELASSIQKKMLPPNSPKITEYAVAGKNVTASEVGGDYFDYIQMDNHLWAFCLGDISGKGLPASLLMTNLQAILRGQTYHLKKPGDILKNANRQLYQSTSAEKFATLFLAILDTSTHTFHYSNAGHDYPFLLKTDGSHQRLKTGGLPLGMMEDSEYDEESVLMQKDDLLFVFSDGVTDVTNENEKMLGEELILDLLNRAISENEMPDHLIKIVVDTCKNHCGNAKLFDDITAIALKRTAINGEE